MQLIRLIDADAAAGPFGGRHHVALANLYSAFAKYPRSADIDACPHCVSLAQKETLARGPLQALSPEQLAHFAFKAMTTWGGPTDYKHFLPRILELAATKTARGFLGFDLQVIVDKMQMAGFDSWPTEEAQSVRNAVHAFWEATLACEPANGPWRAAELLPAIAALSGDVSEHLSAWAEDKSLCSALHLADFVREHISELVNDTPLENECRGMVDESKLRAWLKNPERLSFLNEAFERHIDSPAANELVEVLEMIAWTKY